MLRVIVKCGNPEFLVSMFFQSEVMTDFNTLNKFVLKLERENAHKLIRC
jgi:hypothetical protein